MIILTPIPTDLPGIKHGQRQNDKKANAAYEQSISFYLDDNEEEAINNSE